MLPLTDLDREVYKRQIQLPGFGEEAQRKLRNSSALISRVGGLGGPVSLYLAMAGIGKVVLAHGGDLTPSNMNRMILMKFDHIGKPRGDVMKDQFARLAPNTEVVVIPDHADDAKALEWVAGVDIVCDCSPDFAERFALNKACVQLGKPMIEAAMYGMEGTLTTLVPGETPCLQCLVPEKPPWWQVLGFPVIGAVPGALGCLAALEAIKVLTGYGETLKNQMLTFDADAMEFLKFPVSRRPDCPVCGGL
jgi:molybdopterin/thiamine biosynthesis adenylyltransferase